MLSGLLAMPCESTCCCVCWSRHPSLPDVVLSWQPWKTFYPALPINGTGEDLRALMSNASDAEKPNGESGAAWGGGSCPPQLPVGAVPVTMMMWASARSLLLEGQGGNVRQSWPGLS